MKKLQITVLGVTGSVLAFMLVLPALVSAQPGSTPPTGVVDANFNSVNVTNDVTAGGDVNAGADINAGSFVNAVTGFRLNGAGVFAIDQVGSLTRIYDNTVQPINLYDTNGVTFGGPIWTGTAFSDGKPLVVGDPDGLRVTGYGGTQGLEIAATGDISDSNGGVVINDADGVNITGATTVTGDVTYTGRLNNALGLAIESNGNISDNSGSVVFNDASGVTVANGSGTSVLQITPSGNNAQLSAPSAGESLWFNDSDGVDVRGPIFNWSAPLQIGNAAKGNQNVVINTHLQLPGGLGTTYARSVMEAVAASGVSNQLSVACDSGDKAISCGAGGAAGSTSAFELNYVRLNPDWSETCQGRGTNNWGSVRTFEVHIKCWNLDG